MAIDRVALLRNAETLLRQGKLDQAIAEYRRAVDDQPRDWNTANVLGDLYLRARQVDKAVEIYLRIADNLGRDGFWSKAGALYKKILKIRPHDEHVLLQAAEMSAGQELFVDARAYLNDVREQRRSRGDAAGVAAITIRLGALDPSDYAARLAGARAQAEIGEVPAGVGGLKQLANELTEQGRRDEALTALREAARFAPADVEVKNSLARILGDRMDEDSADEAGGLALELSEAAIARGDWPAAVSALLESLKRWPANIYVLSNLVEVSVKGGMHDVATSAQTQLADAYLAEGSAAEARFIAEDLVARHPQDTAHIDRLRRALTMTGEADPESVISARISALEPLVESRPMPQTGVVEPVVEQAPPPKALDDVFADLREEAARGFATNNPEQELAAGMTFYHAGQLDFAVPRLEAASRAPRHRFEAAATLGRIFLERGDTWRAIEWLERALEAPGPTPAETHRLLYELADALEGVGEVARALAICLELQADAGDYQDVSTRVDRLVKVQARG